MKRPNFFIVGAPKCGTTSLCHYLRQHPDIFIPDQKELNFFASDVDMPRYYNSCCEYIKPFAGTPKAVCGEGTTWYLYSKTAAEEIKDFNHEAKIIIALRRPTDMVYSLFRFRRYHEVEQSEFLSDALAREDEYVDALQEIMPVRREHIYTRAALYYGQVKRYIETFGPGRVHVVLFDDVKEPGASLLRDVEFFGSQW